MRKDKIEQGKSRVDFLIGALFVVVGAIGAGILCLMAGYIHKSEIPFWFAPLIWTYLGLYFVLLLYSLFTKGKSVNLGKFKFSLTQLIIGVGISYIVVVLAIIVSL